MFPSTALRTLARPQGLRKGSALTLGATVTLSTRSATTISSPNDTKLTNLLARLDKFDNESKIFDKLDELYLLSQRKGFFNLNSNNLEFLSNNNQTRDKMNNLYNFNNLNTLVSNQYSNLLMLPMAPSAMTGGLPGINSANLLPSPRTGSNSSPESHSGAGSGSSSTSIKPSKRGSTSTINVTIKTNNNAFANGTPNFFSSSSSIAKAIPGFNAFSSVSSSNTNAPVDKYLNLLQGLARNDVELKNRIEQVLEAFNNEDDFFFNYVLEFWISGKSFNKSKAKKLEEERGEGQLPSNLTM